jgi:hypothetical protein
MCEDARRGLTRLKNDDSRWKPLEDEGGFSPEAYQGRGMRILAGGLPRPRNDDSRWKLLEDEGGFLPEAYQGRENIEGRKEETSIFRLEIFCQ